MGQEEHRRGSEVHDLLFQVTDLAPTVCRPRIRHQGHPGKGRVLCRPGAPSPASLRSQGSQPSHPLTSHTHPSRLPLPGPGRQVHTSILDFYRGRHGSCIHGAPKPLAPTPA